MATDDIPESDNLVLRNLQAMRKQMGEGFTDIGERLAKVEATLKLLTVEFQIAAR